MLESTEVDADVNKRIEIRQFNPGKQGGVTDIHGAHALLTEKLTLNTISLCNVIELTVQTFGEQVAAIKV